MSSQSKVDKILECYRKIKSLQEMMGAGAAGGGMTTQSSPWEKLVSLVLLMRRSSRWIRFKWTSARKNTRSSICFTGKQ